MAHIIDLENSKNRLLTALTTFETKVADLGQVGVQELATLIASLDAVTTTVNGYITSLPVNNRRANS
jgi:hypothetical protein